MAVNQNLKSARNQLGLTQDDMAKLLNYNSKATYNNIENNKVKITLETARKLSIILNKTIPELFPNFFENKVHNTDTSNKNHSVTELLEFPSPFPSPYGGQNERSESMK